MRGYLAAAGLVLLTLPVFAAEVVAPVQSAIGHGERKATAAAAQQQQPQMSPALRGLALAIQQVSVGAESLVAEHSRQIADLAARVAEMERLCGDTCKTLVEQK